MATTYGTFLGLYLHLLVTFVNELHIEQKVGYCRLYCPITRYLVTMNDLILRVMLIMVSENVILNCSQEFVLIISILDIFLDETRLQRMLYSFNIQHLHSLMLSVYDLQFCLNGQTSKQF